MKYFTLNLLSVTMTPQVRQRLAGKLFYQWAEVSIFLNKVYPRLVSCHRFLVKNNIGFQAIGNRLEEMLVEDKKHVDNVISVITDPDGQRDLLQQDEEEDFLDEGTKHSFKALAN